MAEIRVTVCDECGDLEREALQYSVVGPDRRIDLDLCEEHAQALVEYLDRPEAKKKPGRKPSNGAARPAKKATAKKATKKTGRPSKRVMTMEEIEALKKSS